MPFCAISGYAKTLPLTASFPCVQPFPIGIFMSLNVQPMLWLVHKNFSLGGFGATGGNRTRMGVSPTDFKSVVYTCFHHSRLCAATLDAINIADTAGFKTSVLQLKQQLSMGFAIHGISQWQLYT